MSPSKEPLTLMAMLACTDPEDANKVFIPPVGVLAMVVLALVAVAPALVVAVVVVVFFFVVC
jgi:hypothetical protein